MFKVYKFQQMKPLLFPTGIVLLFLLITAIIIYVFHGLMSQSAVAEMWRPEQKSYTLIVDAGHGGLDGGAVAADGTRESDLNLEIAQRMEGIAGLCGIPAVMTRQSNELNYPDNSLTIHQKKVWDQRNRLELIQSIRNGILVSIHQNTFPDTRPNGTEVLYAKTNGSRELAELTHSELIRCLNPDNRRVAMPISDSIYLMKQVKCMAILIECGFLSNINDADHLKTADYQKRLAVTIMGSYLQYLSFISETEVNQ